MVVALPIALPLLALLVLAAREDVRTRRISNRLVVLGLISSVVVRFVLEGGPGIQSAAVGALVAGGLLLPGWLLGWTGAGDVKLMAVSGAWLGAAVGGMAVLFSLIAGGVFAVAVAIRHHALRQSLSGAAAIGMWAMSPHTGPAPVSSTGLRFPFALAILTGTFAALWVQG
jgi:prepilin peptidase CpaA